MDLAVWMKAVDKAKFIGDVQAAVNDFFNGSATCGSFYVDFHPGHLEIARVFLRAEATLSYEIPDGAESDDEILVVVSLAQTSLHRGR